MISQTSPPQSDLILMLAVSAEIEVGALRGQLTDLNNKYHEAKPRDPMEGRVCAFGAHPSPKVVPKERIHSQNGEESDEDRIVDSSTDVFVQPRPLILKDTGIGMITNI